LTPDDLHIVDELSSFDDDANRCDRTNLDPAIGLQ